MPVFTQAREKARQASCTSNLRQIGFAVLMYAQDYNEEFPTGGYPGPRNWEVKPETNPYGGNYPGAYNDQVDCLPDAMRGAMLPGPPLTGCLYGFEFYRILMHVQLNPYLKSTQIWYCPSDAFAKSSARNAQIGYQSYHWFPNWLFNHSALQDAYCARPPFLENDNPSARVERSAERILMSERGLLGWQGPDSTIPAWRHQFNHEIGYNILYFDGHVKMMPYGKKKTTIPRTHWPPCS